MLKKWFRRTVLATALLSWGVLCLCQTLAFSGDWVGKYAAQIEIAAVITYFTSVPLTLFAISLYRNKLTSLTNRNN